jgi:hypothetical protein
MPTSPSVTAAAVRQRFLAVLPRVERHARIRFRGVRCPHARADAVAETLALAWSWFVALVRWGQDPTRFASVLATYAVRHVRSGRRLCGQEPVKDVLSTRAQARHGFLVASLPQGSCLLGNDFDEALRDNTQSPVPDQVAFRADFPSWLATRSQRDRCVVGDLMVGERTTDVADRHGLSQARVSQLRREFMEDWRAFHGEAWVC